MTTRVLACAVALLASFEAAAQVVTVPALPKKGYIGMSYVVAGGLIPETHSTAARAVTYPVVFGVEECSPHCARLAWKCGRTHGVRPL